MRGFILFLFLSLTFSACKTNVTTDQASANAKRFPFRGKIVSVDRAAKKAKINHEAVEGYMEAMTMDFPVHADMVWDDLTPGSEVKADLVVDSASKDGFWLENLVISASAKPGQGDVPVNENFAQIGTEVPDFSLTNQDGKKISLKEFRGKALAITFMYAKCPLPDYCIRMSTNFSDLANQINADPELKDRVRLLSVSFDPANDTPQKLKAYGLGYMGKGATDLGVWQLAVGTDAEVRRIADFFGLRYEVDPTDKAVINHSLITAVVAPGGKVTRIFTGNEWTPFQLLNELKAANNTSKKA